MTAPAIKPGTRCECVSAECPGVHNPPPNAVQCFSFATCLVPTFFRQDGGFGREMMRDMNLCAPCAEYHEARQKAGA